MLMVLHRGIKWWENALCAALGVCCTLGGKKQFFVWSLVRDWIDYFDASGANVDWIGYFFGFFSLWGNKSFGLIWKYNK